MIRSTALLSVLCLPLLAAVSPVRAQTIQATPATAQTLLRFDTPGHQAAEVTPIAYHCHYRHPHRYCHRD